MPQYIATVEDAGPEKAVGVWFPDLPGCLSAGDTLDEAIANAPAAVALYAEALQEEGRALPKPRSLAALKSDPTFVEEIRGNLVALVAAPAPSLSAAE
jgi:predicted RNase H-like HicB family nuclease